MTKTTAASFLARIFSKQTPEQKYAAAALADAKRIAAEEDAARPRRIIAGQRVTITDNVYGTVAAGTTLNDSIDGAHGLHTILLDDGHRYRNHGTINIA